MEHLRTPFNRLLLSSGAAYLRASPLDVGRWRMINHFLPILRAQGREMDERIVVTRYGFRYKADLGDWLGQYVYLTGTYEPSTARLIAKLLEPGDTFIDVGANSGFFTLLASKKVGSEGKVMSFEPLPSMRQRIQENLLLNKFDNVTLHDVALSNLAGEVTFYEGPKGHKGISSLRPIDEAAGTLAVRTVPLDDLADTVQSIKLIKIDVEGAEQLVVEGMKKLLSRHQPYLILEITDQYLGSFGHSAESLCAFLRNIGYRMYKISPEGLVEISAGNEKVKAQYNALFSLSVLPADY